MQTFSTGLRMLMFCVAIEGFRVAERVIEEYKKENGVQDGKIKSKL